MHSSPRNVLHIVFIFILMPVLAVASLVYCRTSFFADGNTGVQNVWPDGSHPAVKGKELVMLTWKDILKFARSGNPKPDTVIIKSDAEWRAMLTPDQYRITRQKGTERPFSSELCSLFEPGLYSCVCCNTLLFNSEEKFESGTGWPSFTQPIRVNAIAYHEDNSYGMQRIETLCNTCGAHLGHVFPDGPAPAGLRYCINALALKKVKQMETKS